MKLKSQTPEAEIPTSSMADIAFLLIIFFMVTAVFASTKGLEFKLPKDEDEAPPNEADEAVFISVGVGGSISVDCQPMAAEDILGYLDPKLSRNPEKPVILYSEPAAPYKTMLKVYDQLVIPERKEIQEAGTYGFQKVKNISVPTKTDIERYVEAFGVNPFETHCN